MSTVTSHIDALAADAVSRKPRQGRSLASFDRMLAATKSLMLEMGSEDFTLQDVSERGNVSIGSIYLRFESKDRLLRAVIAEELHAIIAAEKVMVENVLERSENLALFLEVYIDRYSAFLEERSKLLRTIMQRASIDPAVSEPGKEAAYRSFAMTVKAILTFRDEIQRGSPERKANAVLPMIFATVARQYGLGANPESGDPKSWSLLKTELSKMAYAYLIYAD